MKDKYTICISMSGNSVGCGCCIRYSYGGVKPCYQHVPDYIHDRQIKKFIIARRKYV